MTTEKKYKLPPLGFDYGDLEPYISREIMELHHMKHHQAYVDGANATLAKMAQDRADGKEPDAKADLRSLSFNLGGHILHSAFWQVLGPAKETAKTPEGKFSDALADDFGGWERFRREFSQAALSVEGSGWAALAYHPVSGLVITQIEKHNLNNYPEHRTILLLDVWEHAYYLDYKNQRAKYIDAFWQVLDWQAVGRNYREAAGK